MQQREVERDKTDTSQTQAGRQIAPLLVILPLLLVLVSWSVC